MSFLVKQPSLPQGLGAADPKLNSGYKAADVVPWGMGSDIYPSKWITNKFDEHSQPGSKNAPDWQYCSILAGYAIGTYTYIGKVYSGGKEITNFNYTFGPGENSHTFTINPALASGRAWQAIVRRGLPTQTSADFANVTAFTGQQQPGYKDYLTIEWLNIDLGAGTTALPQLSVELRATAPAIGDYAGGDSDRHGVNPFAAIYVLLAAKWGGDFDAALLDATHWGDQCIALEAIGVSGRTLSLTWCHPMFTSSTSLADAISQILAYVDGYIYAENGQLKVGWFPSAAVDPASLPEIAEADLEEKPSGGIPDWNEGATSAVVVFRSFDRDYGDDAARYNAPANRESNVTADPVRKDRPFIHSPDQAAMIAAECATDSSNDEISTSLTVFKSRAVDGTEMLTPGDLMNWDYAPHALDLVCRVTARRLRMNAASDVLTITRERGAYPRPYVAPVDDRVLPAADDPGVINVADVRLWLLPSGLTSLREVAAIVNRTKRTIYRADLYLSAAGTAPWQDILESHCFAAKGAVNNAGINDSATTVRIASTSVDWARMTAQSAIAQLNNTLLLLIDDELMSVGTITVVSAGVYDLSILRGRLGTVAAAHALAATSWLFFRSEIDSVEHQEFYRVRTAGAYDAALATKHFKLQLFTLGVDGLAKPDDPGISFTLPDLSASELLGYTILITNEAHTVACDVAGNVLAGQLGAGGTGKTIAKVFRGSTALTAVAAGPNSDQYSIALGTLTNTTATKETNDTVRCDTLTADTGTIDITISVAGAFTVTKTFTLTKSKVGATGATGATGADGPGVVYRGAYDGTKTYYYNSKRRDIVSSGGNYYLANNLGKDGLNTWGAPGGADWTAFGASFSSVATDILLTVDATILKTLVMGDGATDNAGIIRSAGATAFATGIGYWFNPRNTAAHVAEFRIGDPAGNRVSWDGTTILVQGQIIGTTGFIGNFQFDGSNIRSGTVGSSQVIVRSSGNYDISMYDLFGREGNYNSRNVDYFNSSSQLIGRFGVGGGFGRAELYNSSVTKTVDLNGSSRGSLAFQTTNFYESAADTLKTDDSLIVVGNVTAGSLTTTHFKADDGASSADVMAANLRVFSDTARTTQTWRVDNTNGDTYIQLARVLKARITGWGTAPSDGVRNALTASSSQADHNDALRALIADLHQTAGHGMIGT